MLLCHMSTCVMKCACRHVNTVVNGNESLLTSCELMMVKSERVFLKHVSVVQTIDKHE